MNSRVMAKQQYTRDLYETLLTYYRDNAEDHGEAARRCKCSRKVAQTAYEKGWRGLGWAKPIHEVLESEQMQARASRLQREREALAAEEQARIDARKDALEARSAEAKGAKLSRANAIMFAAACAKALAGLQRLVVEFEGRTQNQAAVQAMSLKEIRYWITTVSGAVRDAQVMLKTALEIERIVTGEPLAVLSIRAEKMSPQEMYEELTHTMQSLRILKQLPTGDEGRDAALDILDIAP